MGLLLKTIFVLAIMQGVFGNAPKMFEVDNESGFSTSEISGDREETSPGCGPFQVQGPKNSVQSVGYPGGTGTGPQDWECDWQILCSQHNYITYTTEIQNADLLILQDTVSLQVSTPQTSNCPFNEAELPIIIGSGCEEIGILTLRRNGSINGQLYSNNVAYRITFECSSGPPPTTLQPPTASTTIKADICEDEWPENKCKKCTGKKCKKGSCVKKCKSTCNLCEDVEEECEDKWPEKKCKKCDEKKCIKDKNCKNNCQKTCKLCDDRTLAFDPFY
jgi:hypothetical protein